LLKYIRTFKSQTSQKHRQFICLSKSLEISETHLNKSLTLSLSIYHSLLQLSLHPLMHPSGAVYFYQLTGFVTQFRDVVFVAVVLKGCAKSAATQSKLLCICIVREPFYPRTTPSFSTSLHHLHSCGRILALLKRPLAATTCTHFAFAGSTLPADL